MAVTYSNCKSRRLTLISKQSTD